MGKIIAVAGSSGFIGSHLTRYLEKKGHTVRPLYHHEKVYQNVLEGCDVLVNLAGVNIAKRRWTRAFKKVLWESRVDMTRRLVDAMETCAHPPTTFLSASGIFDGGGFLFELREAWEKEALRYSKGKVSLMRIGAVLSAEGGMLKGFLPPAKRGLYVTLGSGENWIPWIAMEDLVSKIEALISLENDQIRYNLMASHPVTQKEFFQELKKIYPPKITLRIPSCLTSFLLGEMGKMLIAKGEKPHSTPIGIAEQFPSLNLYFSTERDHVL